MYLNKERRGATTTHILHFPLYIRRERKKKIREDPSSLYVYTHRLYDEGEEKDIFPLKKKK